MKNEILKLYVNKDYVTSKLAYTPLLFPFWGPVLKKETPFVSAALKKYGFDSSCYTLVNDIKDADFVLAPHNYWYFKGKPHSGFLEKCVVEAGKYGKLILIDAQGDPHEHINIKNSYVLRTSQYRFRLKENEIMIPTYVEDLLESYCGGKIETRKKQNLPSVGFTGWAAMPFLSRTKSLVKEFPIRFSGIFDKKIRAMEKGIFFREKTLKILGSSDSIKPNFILRNFFSGHIGSALEDQEKLRREFIDNIKNSDYTLCIKGDGNFSFRFYETLSLGRIPLFVDTATVLPLEDIINYKDFCLFVDYRDISRIDEILSGFHKNISEEKFEEMQKKARDAFENYLRIDRFTKYLTEKLKKIADEKYVRDKRI